MDRLSRLVAIQEIRQLKARYFWCLDMKDWDMIRREVFTPETTFLFAEAQETPFPDAESFIAMLERELAGKVSVHHGHTSVIEITSETTATGNWAMVDHIFVANGPAARANSRFLEGYGHYHETYEKRDEGWRIASIRLSRLHTESENIS